MLIPLVLNERLLGIINLSKKSNLRRYNAADFRFLATLKNQSTIAISNSLLYENIEEQHSEDMRIVKILRAEITELKTKVTTLETKYQDLEKEQKVVKHSTFQK